MATGLPAASRRLDRQIVHGDADGDISIAAGGSAPFAAMYRGSLMPPESRSDGTGAPAGGDIEVPVLIVGGSMVGMTAALLSGHHGVRTLVVEHHRGTAIHPRAASVTQRTMEIFRSVGIEEAVRSRSEAQFVQDAGVVGVETLAGGATAHYIANFNEGIRDLSPTVRVFLSQNALEPILRESAERSGAQIRFATACSSFEQDEEGVVALIRHRDTGETQRVRARYLVAADGARSRIREQLGLRLRGHGVFSQSVTIYFRAGLRRLLEDRPWAVVYVNHPQLRGFFRFEKPFDSGFLVVNTLGDAARPEVDVSAGLGAEEALRLVRTAIGSADIPVTVENVMHWQARADTVEQFRRDRVFIAGDAAHVMPPTGGWGGNTGVQDAHNLAWKLAMVLRGDAGPGLLDTYDAERRPVGELTAEQAYTRYLLRTDPSIPRDTMQPLVGDMRIELGYAYRSRAVVAESIDAAASHLDPRESRALPGTRAPHYWLERDGRPVSTLDLCDREFTLFLASEDAERVEQVARAAGEIAVHVSVVQPGKNGILDPTGGFAAAYGLAPGGCVLVRPDGFVAWRARDGADRGASRISDVLNAVLCR